MKTWLLSTALTLLFGVGQAFGQSAVAPKKFGNHFKYSVVFLCLNQSPFLADGQYATMISVHNPQSKRVEFTKKGAATLPEGDLGDVGVPQNESLGPDQGFTLDCDKILAELLPNASPASPNGFVVIESPEELDVWVSYSRLMPPIKT